MNIWLIMELLDKNYKKYLSGMDIIGEIAIIKIKSELRSETWHFMFGRLESRLNITAPPPRNGSK